ncbi:uncharacterized protein LOC107275056 isoform X2 [Cephus cinctus]|uniref:Uncharacterized protein LOC107275056 isoform X2 n=1 Tax=Cephus cinctus TaxID=211228 RepID=A0AAJ7CHC9_CEPCN|nr:uncharacterized protein LOC107275056 isoform X2 [Cephus cinctus]
MEQVFRISEEMTLCATMEKLNDIAGQDEERRVSRHEFRERIGPLTGFSDINQFNIVMPRFTALLMNHRTREGDDDLPRASKEWHSEENQGNNADKANVLFKDQDNRIAR